METHEKKYKVRLGLFIAGGLVLFVIAVFFIGKQQNMFDPVFKLSSNFYNVSGLQVGNNVRFSGINVGVVDNINIINDSTVHVQMLIRKNVNQFIKSDAIVALGSDGLIGDKLLLISQGSKDAPIVEEGQHIGSIEPIEIDDIIASLKVTAGHAEIISKELAEILFQINSGKGTLGKLIHDSSIADNISQSSDNLKRGSKGLTDIMSHINSGKGTLGRLIQDTTMAVNISQTMVNLERSSKGMEETIEAVQNNFLLRGFFKKKAKEEEKEKKAAEKNTDPEIKAIEIKVENENQ